MRLGIITAASILVAGTVFAAAQSTQQSPPQAPETGMPSDTGQNPGTRGQGGGSTKTSPPAKTNPPQGPETGMPSDTGQKTGTQGKGSGSTKTSPPAKTNPPQGPETGMPSDTKK